MAYFRFVLNVISLFFMYSSSTPLSCKHTPILHITAQKTAVVGMSLKCSIQVKLIYITANRYRIFIYFFCVFCWYFLYHHRIVSCIV